MLAYAAKRLALALLVALTVSIAAFALVRVAGDVATAIAGEGARAADIEAIRHQYGLDRPLALQYADWLWKTLQGDLGESLYFKRPVLGIVLDRLPVTMILGALSIGFALALSIPLGVAAALRPNTWIDRT